MVGSIVKIIICVNYGLYLIRPSSSLNFGIFISSEVIVNDVIACDCTGHITSTAFGSINELE